MITLKKQKVEYEINNKIKYTTLKIRSMLVKKINRKKATKRTPTQIPQGKWGMGSKEPIPKIILFIIGYNISELKN